MIPLEHIFGFSEDYDKVVYGLRHTLRQERTNDNDAIFKDAAVGDTGKVKLSKISWMMPRVPPNEEMKYKLYKSIESKVVLDAAFRKCQWNIVEILQSTTISWRLGVCTAPEKPRYILLGIQTDKSGHQDHSNVVLSNTKYPPHNANPNFTKYQFAQFYKYDRIVIHPWCIKNSPPLTPTY